MGLAAGLAYDPLAVPRQPVQHVDLDVKDTARQETIPIRVYLPAGPAAAPVILFSHGLGGTREGYAYLGEHWAARGYVCIFVQHPGSDDSAWKGSDDPMASLKDAASLRNFKKRVEDIPAVLNQLSLWQKASGNPLYGRMDLQHVGMAGHSFGAITTQAVSGESYALGLNFTDSRIEAAIAMSPSPNKRDNAHAFTQVHIPWLLMTGTHDESGINGDTAADRLAVFPVLPPGDKYQVVLFNAQHSAFSDRDLPGDQPGRNPNHYRVILALSTAFWDTYLRGDVGARAWLQGDGPRTVMESQDDWQKR